jgi:glucose-6-phosphate isomerase
MNHQTASWQRFSKYLQYYPTAKLTLDISRMRFDESFLAERKPALTKALDEMKSLEAGEIANPDEQRMVGHYWLRDPQLAPTPEISSQITETIKKIKSFATDIHNQKIKTPSGLPFKNIILVGIGGSALGPQLLAEALWSSSYKMKLYFSDNTDPDGMKRVIEEIGSGLKETLVIIISKSGGTVETDNGRREFAQVFTKNKLNFAAHFVAITMANSKLHQIATQEKWLNSFEIWDWVGGRTSLFSAVGLVPAALLGIDLDQFLAGAKEMDLITKLPDTEKNPACLLALMWHFAGNGRGEKDMVVLPYKDRLLLLSKYLQQLVMESLGKEKNRAGEVVHQGIAVYGNKGSTDQHAYVQQLREGVPNFFALFIEVLSDLSPEFTKSGEEALKIRENITSGDFLSGFYLGTREALYENGRDSISITLDELTPYTLGGLIALFERTVGIYASLVNINAYHQPGVEAGKKAAERIVALQQQIFANLPSNLSNKPLSVSEICEALKTPGEEETVYKILEHLASNSGRGIKRASASRLPQEVKYFLGN